MSASSIRMRRASSGPAAPGQQTEFELRVGDDDAAGLGVGGSFRIQPQRQIANAGEQSGVRSASLACASVMLMSWPLCALVAGVKIGCGRRSDSRSPAGSRDAAHLAGGEVVLPRRSRQIAARDALDRQRRRSPSPASIGRGTAAASSRIAAGYAAGSIEIRWLSTIGRVRSNQNDRHLGQDLALVRNAGARARSRTRTADRWRR